MEGTAHVGVAFPSRGVGLDRIPCVSTDIAASLTALGVTPTDDLLVHSSYRSLGPDRPAITAVIAALQEVVRDGTLLMPALSYATVDAGHPDFDVRTTPSCVGAIPEVFRTLPGVVRSLHPSHSVAARGVRADWFTSDHLLDDTPVGPHSPLAKLRDARGLILFLGCGLEPNTSMHGVEELVFPPYLFLPTPVPYRVTDTAGQTRSYTGRRHNFTDGEFWYKQRYDRIENVLDPRYIRQGQIGAAPCWVVEAAPLWEAALTALRRDPLYFVERLPV